MMVWQPAREGSGICAQEPCLLQEGVKWLLMRAFAVLEMIVKHHGE
jgi:hypothetical protein